MMSILVLKTSLDLSSTEEKLNQPVETYNYRDLLNASGSIDSVTELERLSAVWLISVAFHDGGGGSCMIIMSL